MTKHAARAIASRLRALSARIRRKYGEAERLERAFDALMAEYRRAMKEEPKCPSHS